MKTALLFIALVLMIVFVSGQGQKKFNEPCSAPRPCGGKRCKSGFKPQGDCLPGLKCKQVCKYEDGHACTQDSECVASFCYLNKCSTRGTWGTPCTTISQCKGALICKENKCTDRTYNPVGSPCKSTVECQFGCIDNRCTDKAVNNCYTDEECGGQLKCIGGSCY